MARTLTTFNCYACHVRNKIGGPEEALNKFFLTVQPEMGDEGRLPPTLTGVGAKLNPDYVKQILDKGTHDRPYMHTRMPGFGDANVGHLVAAFDSLDSIAKAPAVTFAVPMSSVKSNARKLVGGQAFGCIKCHTFNGVKAEGVQGIDMTLLPKRLKHDWFHAYVENPQSIRPGTRMPASFDNGKSVLPEILDGKPATQIEAIWLYLADGPKAQTPAGMGKQSIPLVPTSGAILYRNFIQEGGTKFPRAIAVGYPEKAHLAFDANEMYLALLWQGDFMDAGRHWTGRGEGYESPLGDNILQPAGWRPVRGFDEGRRNLARRLGQDAGLSLPRLSTDRGRSAHVSLHDRRREGRGLPESRRRQGDRDPADAESFSDKSDRKSPLPGRGW